MTRRVEHGRMVRVDACDPNPWNDNKMNDRIFAKERRSIREFGFVDPITVRAIEGGRFQLVDGEHRWLAAKDESLIEIPATILHDYDERAAKKLTIILNRLRGVPQHELTARLIADLAHGGIEDIVDQLPFEEPEVRVMLDLAAGAWDLSSEPKTGVDHDDPWTTFKVRVPKGAVDVIERACLVAGRDNNAPKEARLGLGLERIAADFLAGADPAAVAAVEQAKKKPSRKKKDAQSAAPISEGGSGAESENE